MTKKANRLGFCRLLITRLKLILGLTITASVGKADILWEPWPKRVCPFPAYVTVSEDLPMTFTKGDFRITISTPSSPSMREAGGSGGPMLEFTVRNLKTGWKTSFFDQCVNGALLEPFNGRPQFEVWGRGGGGYFDRELIRFVRGEYQSIRVDNFTGNEHESGANTSVTAELPGDTLTLYLLDKSVPDDTHLPQGQ